ncbi:D-2-hydroxyacid dehydrogenase [Brevifollis gellanilyticus]|uniref:3-phosphoglycerate dehydrogenase n=1 Tax=Brevifollis gellanilyticus TaxID=748831 RepID=A0A512M782_9BACT|nr:D-2-hydroxyacid dehydrogenase [Brevifollis gellanilyticus]GEP42596.1 3-phosphoglycerate dehydrogenase [Brevifollis gellanilyticus]
MKPLCLTTALPFIESAPGSEPAIEGLDVRVLRGMKAGEAWPEDEADRVEVMFCTTPPPNLAKFKKLQWLQIESAGFSQLFPFGLNDGRITVTNARGIFDCPIAEWNIAMMINLARDLRTLIRHQDAHIWERSAQFTGEIRGRTVGIWGYGGIGRETARLAKVMGMRVHVLTRSGVKSRVDSTCIEGSGDPDGSLPDRYFTEQEKEEFLKGLDFLILALPLTKKTDGLLGEPDLRLLPKGAFVLNPARGPLIQEQALLAVLRDGHLGGAALDTHYAYPLPAEHPLWSFQHVILTPHISGTSFSPNFSTGLLNIFRLNAPRYLAGEPLLNIIPPTDLQ